MDAELPPYAVTALISYTGTAALLRRRIRDFMLPLYKARGYRYATYEFWFLD